LTTDGAGTLSFATIDISSIQNGTSNVKIATSGGNVAMSVAGTSNVVVVSSGAMDLAGNLNVTGNVTVTGNLNYLNVTDMVVGDPLIFIGANNAADTFDLGFSARYDNGSVVHTGFARDATDGTWKLFDGVAAAPTTVIDFAAGTLAPIAVGNASIGNLAVVGSASAASIQITGETDTDTLVVQNGADLGDVADLTITGGNAGEVLSTDGTGVLSWIPFPSMATYMNTVSGAFTFAGGTAFSISLPSGAVVDEVIVIVDSVFDGAPTVEVGVSGNTGKYVATTDTDLTSVDRYEFPQSYLPTVAETVDVKVTNGGATVGAGRVLVHYSIPA
jgi:hypothetical protein